MDSFELNKIMGAVLGTLLFVMGVGFLAEAIYEPIEGRGAGYALPEPEPTEGAATADAAPEVPLGVLLANASVENGAAATRKCQSCHDFTEGGPNKQGPDLYGVVGRPIASHEGFTYSASLMEHGANGETWTYENLNHFITKPKSFAADTKMNFGGVASPEERADILAFLSTLSHDPVPFPAPEEAAAPDNAAAAADGAQPEAATPAEAADSVELTPAQEGNAGAAPAADATPAVEPTPSADPAQTVETPSTTQSETSVEGTPASGGDSSAGAETGPAAASPEPAPAAQ